VCVCVCVCVCECYLWSPNIISGTAQQTGISWVPFLVVILLFFVDLTLPTALWPGDDPGSNINEYHNIFWGVKAAGT